MIIDPHIAAIRVSAEAGEDFYTDVMRRVLLRSEQPTGLLMHFTESRPDEFVVWTAFRDIDAMTYAFTAFSSVEAQNEMVASGRTYDLKRSEYPIEQIFIDPDYELRPFQLTGIDGLAAIRTRTVTLDLDEYHSLLAATGRFERPVPGLVAHVSYSEEGRVHLIDFWTDRAAGDAWYGEHFAGITRQPTFAELTPQTLAAGWFEPPTFLATPALEELGRRYIRHAPGPSTA